MHRVTIFQNNLTDTCTTLKAQNKVRSAKKKYETRQRSQVNGREMLISITKEYLRPRHFQSRTNIGKDKVERNKRVGVAYHHQPSLTFVTFIFLLSTESVLEHQIQNLNNIVQYLAFSFMVVI